MPYRHYPDHSVITVVVRPDAHRVAKEVATERKQPIIKIITDAIHHAYPNR